MTTTRGVLERAPRDFVVTCGAPRCGRRVTVLSAVLLANDDGSLRLANVVVGRDRAASPGVGVARSEGITIDRLRFTPKEAQPADANTWFLRCTGRRCRMRQRIGWETLNAAVVRAVRDGRYELVLGLDFTRSR